MSILKSRAWKFIFLIIWNASYVSAGPVQDVSVGGPLAPLEGVDLLSGVPVKIPAPEHYRVLVFLSARCPCSISHEASLKDLAVKFNTFGFQFIGIHSNKDEPAELTRAHFETSQLGFPVIQDEKAKWANQFAAFKTPHAFVINSDGAVLYSGGIDNGQVSKNADRFFLRDALSALKDGRPIIEKETRTLGCVIKRE